MSDTADRNVSGHNVSVGFYSAPGDVGRPIPGTKVRLDDVNEKGIGELVAKGPGVMLGYYENKEATEAVRRTAGSTPATLQSSFPPARIRLPEGSRA